MDIDILQSRLLSAVARHIDPAATITDVQALTGGAASSTWRFELTTAQSSGRCILRCAGGDNDFAVGISKTLEANIQQACFRSGIPVAEVLAVLEPDDQLGEGYIMKWLEGETIPQKILRRPEFDAIRPTLARQCGEMLAQIHRVAAPEELPPMTTAQQIKSLENQYRGYQQPLPSFDLAFRWLHRNLIESGSFTLVHGDFRNGNFLITPEQGIVGILDWELCHVGDPMEDLGWLCVNSWRFGNRHLPVGGFGERQVLYDAYARASGREVFPAQVKFWEVLGTLKWGIMCLHMCHETPVRKESIVGAINRASEVKRLAGQAKTVESAAMTRKSSTISDEAIRLKLPLERAAIGRRVSETEVDLLVMLSEVES